jgi:hypothetical protein
MRGDGPHHARRSILAALAGAAVLVALPRHAGAYCRTTTCGLPPGFSPSPGECQPPDFAARCAALNPPVKVLPVFWSNQCISYDIQQDASLQVPFPEASRLVAAAFAKWIGAHCAGGGHPSMAIEDLGPVECNQVQYSTDQGNQHVIIFHDDVWPHDDASNTLGLTTITFDPDTGEIFDADMELRSTQDITLFVSDPVPDTGYDFQSIVAHETGHFLGMAHSGDSDATMYAHYYPGTTSMRDLTSDDISGICSIYTPNGDRTVDTSVSPSGAIVASECNPIPRHGFQTVCAQPKDTACTTAGSSPGGGENGRSGPVGVAAAALASTVFARRRARARRM